MIRQSFKPSSLQQAETMGKSLDLGEKSRVEEPNRDRGLQLVKYIPRKKLTVADVGPSEEHSFPKGGVDGQLNFNLKVLARGIGGFDVHHSRFAILKGSLVVGVQNGHVGNALLRELRKYGVERRLDPVSRAKGRAPSRPSQHRCPQKISWAKRR